MKKVFIAYIGAGPKEFDSLLGKSQSVIDNFYGTHTADFPNKTTLLQAYNALHGAAVTANAAWINNPGPNETRVRIAAFEALHSEIKLKTCSDINRTFPNDRIKLAWGGLPVTDDPVVHGLADTAVIKRVERVNSTSARIMLEKKTGGKKATQEKRTYIVYQSSDPDFATKTQVLITSDSRKLIVTGLTPKTDYYFAVSIVNASGENELSGRTKYTCV